MASSKEVAVAKPKQKKLNPARKQVKPGEIEHEETPQTGKEYNIWYNKWAGGDREDSYSNKTKAQTKCNIKKDSGLTRANTTGNKYCCLFFSRGCCPYGWECEYLHQLPDIKNPLPDSSRDCFGREKFADYRDDMGGVGSFNRMNRTLYIGRIKETGTGPETEEIVRRHFKDWGEIERDDSETGWAVKVLQYRSVAFVTYVSELSAQFAKEAMACQSLENDEILNVRWATEDPNPTAKVAEKHRLEDMGQSAIKEKMDPRIVDAMRSIRALEDGDAMDEEGNLMIEDAEDGARAAKRRKIQDVDPSEEIEGQDMPSPPASPQERAKSQGLLSADTLESMKYFAEIRQRAGVSNGKIAPPPPSAGLGLADYGSDDDD